MIGRHFRAAAGPAILMLTVSLAETPQAQPTWVKEAAQLEATAEIHEDASLLVLNNHSVTRIVTSGNVTSEVRWAARVLDKAGATLAALNEPVNPRRRIKDLRGWLIRSDGSKAELTKESIAEVDFDQAAGFYDDARSLVAGFSDVKPGDVVAYEYRIEEKDDLTGFFTGFVFQVAEPVVRACFELITPPGWQVNTRLQQGEPVKYEKQAERHVWTAENLAYRPAEPFMPSWSQLSRAVTVGCHEGGEGKARGFSGWSDAAALTRRMSQGATADTLGPADRARQVCAGLTSPAAKLEAIARFVRDEIRYVAVEIGAGRLQPRPSGATLRNKYGDCKDKATLMQTMLAAVGIPSAPVDASLYREVSPEFVSPFVFNHAIVAVPVEAVPDLEAYPDATVDGWLYFDPTNEAIPLGSLSSELRGSYVLKATEADTALTRLPPLMPRDCRRRYRALAALSENLAMKAEVTVIDYGVWADEYGHSRLVTPVKDMVESWQKRFAYIVQNPILSNFVVGADGDSSWVTFMLEASRAATESGPYLLLNTDFFHEDRTDDLTEPERTHPITFGEPAEIVTEIEWRLPPGWTPGDPPEAIVDSCQLASVICEAVHGDRVSLRSTVRYFGGEVGPEQYEAVKRFNKKLNASRRLRTFINRTGK